MEKKPVKITETVLRDAHQSLLATRMRIEDMLPQLEALDKIGYNALEAWGGDDGEVRAEAFKLPFLRAQPQRVEKLIMLDPAGYPMRKVPWMIAATELPGATWAMPLWMPRALIAATRSSRSSQNSVATALPSPRSSSTM